jgi:hypothetical protein
MRSADWRAKLSAAKMGHEVSPETRAKISASVSRALVGREVSEQTRNRIALKQAGERGHNWRGDQVGYGGAHKRHRAALPQICAHCGTTAGRLDVALSHDTPAERLVWCATRERFYSVRSVDYLRLCRSCHIRYDRAADAVARA